MNLILKEKKCFVFDMDGTIYLGDELIKGSYELFQYFNHHNIDYFFLTNNSSNSVKDYINKLNEMGIESGESNIITSSTSTISYLKRNFDICQQVFFIIGTPSMEEEFRKASINFITKKDEHTKIDAVVVGFDTTLTYKKLADASYYLNMNKTLIATNCDYICPLPEGEVTPDCGSIVSLLERTIECSVTYCGKPDIAILEPIFKQGFQREEMIIVGDRLYTDIALGFENEIDTALVLTGEATPQTIVESEVAPTIVLKSVESLYLTLKNKNKNREIFR